MAILQTEWITRQRATTSAACAGKAVVAEFEFTIKAGETLAAADKVELGILPAFHHVVNATLVCDALGGTTTANIGLMSGEVGDPDASRTVGTELFNAADVAAAGAIRMTNPEGFRLDSTDNHRSIGLTVSADTAAAEDLVVTLVLVYAASTS